MQRKTWASCSISVMTCCPCQAQPHASGVNHRPALWARRERGEDPAPFATVVTDLTTCNNT